MTGLPNARPFLDGRVVLHPGDCLEVLAGLPENSVDACVCDPPYHLTSIVKRFGGANAAEAKSDGATGVYGRAARGFMGKQWDGGDIAFRADTWAAVLRVLKPGAHLLAFAAPRGMGRMQVAIEDAGFETRDAILDLIESDTHIENFVGSLSDEQRSQFFRCVEESSFSSLLAWVFGSGFPKSHDVSKSIDRRGGNAHLTVEIASALKASRIERGLSVAECDRRYCGGSTNWSWFEGRSGGARCPTPATFAAIAKDWPEVRHLARAVAQVEREVVGFKQQNLTPYRNIGGTNPSGDVAITIPGSAAAAAWQGFGTALKPAFEPIIMARKPLIGTVAENVLMHGTGAINIDACRIGSEGGTRKANVGDKVKQSKTVSAYGNGLNGGGVAAIDAGRWPANLMHDGRADALGAFPMDGDASAARFFYSAKADANDRIGSKHPTVKPVDLMQYLVRLVTAPGQVVLDPFAGTGTTGEAAFREGRRAILIEREAEYQADIARRMALALAGPEERAREGMKASGKAEAAETLPLFGGAE